MTKSVQTDHSRAKPAKMKAGGKPKADFRHEAGAGAYQGRIIAGTDEAGRGPLAGPVAAAAVILPVNLVNCGFFDHLIDSKLMCRSARIAACKLIHSQAFHGIAIATVEEIDQLNILQASLLAMKRAIEALPCMPDAVLVDGKQPPQMEAKTACLITCLVRGDQRSLSIAAASILAKQYRDTIMQELHQEDPRYLWAQNKGYPTAEHRRALAAYGASPHHRKSFAPVRMRIAEEQQRKMAIERAINQNPF